MSLGRAILTHWTRLGLGLLGLLLIASAMMRIYVYRYPADAGATEAGTEVGATVDIGDGIRLPRADASHSSVPVPGCPPASIDFIEAHPYGSDPSLVGEHHPNDRVFYIYHGWHLESRFATIILNAIYFARRAQARLTMRNSREIDNLALKLIVPADCDASFHEVMAELRRQVRSQP